MRGLSFGFFAFVLAAQVQAPPPQPQWLMDLETARDQIREAPLGSLDGRVEQAWQAALQAPTDSQFQRAAQIAANYYQSQGYDLNAEQVLRQALAVVPPGGARMRRNPISQLANHFESTGQLVKALAMREEMAKEPLPSGRDGYPPPSYDAIALANLYERMGEAEKAEAAWKELGEIRANESSQRSPGWGIARISGSFPIGSARFRQNELAQFYARRGRTAEAEELYKTALAEAARRDSPREWAEAADGYIGFLAGQRRYGEAIDLTRQGIAQTEGQPAREEAQNLLHRRRLLASLLAQAGRPGEAVAVEKEAAAAAQTRNPNGPEYIQALGSLAQTLINQNRLDEAEKTVARMRQAGASDSRGAQFHESMAVQMLARIRDMQNKPEEARRLRAEVGVPDPTMGAGGVDINELFDPARGNVEVAAVVIDRAQALSAERVRSNPEEVSGLIGLANVLASKQEEEAARQIVVQALRLLDRAPDHPRVAIALGSIVPTLVSFGLTADAERAIERQEEILISAKGSDSPALNAVGYARIAIMQRESDAAGVIEERKTMLARVEKATGPNSRESLNALREVAWAYPSVNNWPEEERVLSALAGRTMAVSGESSLDHAHVLQHTANRASQNRQFDQALSLMDKAIEIARALPDAAIHVQGMKQERARMAEAKETPPGGPFHAPSGAPGNRVGRWFDTDAFQRTDGTRPDSAPVGGAAGVRPLVIRRTATPVAAPAPAEPPTPPDP